MRETTLTDPEGILVEPEGATTGVLVLSGSSGRIETDRCRMLASHGVAAASIRYFGGAGLRGPGGGLRRHPRRPARAV